MTEERRRSPRYAVDAGELAILPVSLSVQLLDISVTGVLILSGQTAKAGSRGRLRLDLAGQPFSAEVEVRRAAPSGRGAGFRLGARFLDLSDDQRSVVEAFTHR